MAIFNSKLLVYQRVLAMLAMRYVFFDQAVSKTHRTRVYGRDIMRYLELMRDEVYKPTSQSSCPNTEKIKRSNGQLPPLCK